LEKNENAKEAPAAVAVRADRTACMWTDRRNE